MKIGLIRRVTLDDVIKNIVSEYYFTAAEGVAAKSHDDRTFFIPADLQRLTFCVLVLRNGFTVSGESVCADLVNINTEAEKEIAKNNAIEKVWAFMDYELHSRIALRSFEMA